MVILKIMKEMWLVLLWSLWGVETCRYSRSKEQLAYFVPVLFYQWLLLVVLLLEIRAHCLLLTWPSFFSRQDWITHKTPAPEPWLKSVIFQVRCRYWRVQKPKQAACIIVVSDVVLFWLTHQVIESPISTSQIWPSSPWRETSKHTYYTGI